MGEQKRGQSATQKLIAQYPNCCVCGGRRPTTTREHMPPKALFDNWHRPDKLVFPACGECNSGTATADLVASIISRWEYNNSAQGQKDHARLVAQAKKKCPEIVSEWISQTFSRAERLNHLRRNGVNVPFDAGINQRDSMACPRLCAAR
jgi:hypothetical protein